MVTVGFLGAGAMGSSMAVALTKKGGFEMVVVCDRNPGNLEKTENLARHGAQCPLRCTMQATDMFKSADVIILSIKPQVAAAGLKPLRGAFEQRHLLVSVAAGLTCAQLREMAGPTPRIVRCMPNTPVLVGAGVTAFARDVSATTDDARVVMQMCNAMGLGAEVKESQMDAVTGVSGSGPSYVSVFIEALADGGVMQGLPRALALKLAAQTVYGGGKLAVMGGEGGGLRHPALMKDGVCSPSGTSISGVYALECGNFRATVMSAVKAASERSRALGEPSKL